MIYSVVAFAILLITSNGQDVCDNFRGLNTTRLRQRVNETDGSIIAYSDLSLFLQNGTLIEISLQNASRPERIGRYRIREEKNEETVCVLEREIENTENNYTDCETLTITAKSNSVEGAEGCTIGPITNGSQCLKTCRAQGGGLATENLVAYLINGKVEPNALDSKGRGLRMHGKGRKHMDRMDRSSSSSSEADKDRNDGGSSSSSDGKRRGRKGGKFGKGRRGSESGRANKGPQSQDKDAKQKGQRKDKDGKQGDGNKGDKQPKSKGAKGQKKNGGN